MFITRMCATTAHVQSFDRRAIVGDIGERSLEVELVQGHCTMEYVLDMRNNEHDETAILSQTLPVENIKTALCMHEIITQAGYNTIDCTYSSR